MAKKPVIQSEENVPQYDAQTMAFIEGAKKSIAMNHGLALDRDPAEVMRENNAAIRAAAAKIAPKRGMVKQTIKQQSVPATRQVQPDRPVQNVSARNPVKTQKPPQRASFAKPVEQEHVAADDSGYEAVQTMSYNGLNDEAMRNVGYDALMEQAMRDNNGPDESGEEVSYEHVELSDLQPQQEEPAQETEPVLAPEQSYVQTEEPYQVWPKKVDYVSTNEMPTQSPAQARPSPIYQSTPVTNFSDIRGLPSEGLFYDKPLFGQALTYMDILMVSNIDTVNVTSTINTLLSRRITGGWDTFNADNLLQCDEHYILHWLRASTVDDQPLPYVPPTLDEWVPYTCPECGKVANTQEDYKNIDIHFNNLNFKIDGNLQEIAAKHANGCYTFTLLDGRQCDVYLRRRYHETVINDARKQYEKDVGVEMPVEMRAVLYTAVVVEIEGMETIVDKMNYIAGLGYKEARHLITEVDNASLVTNITANLVCPFCHKEVTIPYPFRFDAYISGL